MPVYTRRNIPTRVVHALNYTHRLHFYQLWEKLSNLTPQNTMHNPLQLWQAQVDLAIRQQQSIPWPKDEPTHFPSLSQAEYLGWMQSVRNAVESRHIYRIQTPGQWLHNREQAKAHVNPWDAATQHREAISQGKVQGDAE